MTARVTGSTESLEQIVRDMEDAGPGATESRTYRAIVAELEHRRRENAPAPDATGDEGSEPASIQREGADSMTTLPNTPLNEKEVRDADTITEDPDSRIAEFEDRDREIGRILDAINNAADIDQTPPGGWYAGAAPIFDVVTPTDEPVRVWSREFADPDERAFSVQLYAEDVLTSAGLRRSPVEVFVDADGMTGDQARALSAAIARAVDALAGSGQ